MLRKFINVFASLCALCFPLRAEYCFPNDLVAEAGLPIFSQRLYLEPRFSYAELKQSSSIQDGWLWGVKGGYDFFLPGFLYFGLEGGYMRGNLSGRVESYKVKSQYRDWWAEGKIGYPLGCPQSVFFVPFLGLGYESERNNYVAPTPSTPKNRMTYWYGSLGFYSQVYFSWGFSIGCNFKAKWPFSGDERCSCEDFSEKSSTSKNLHYNVELPFALYPSACVSIALVPFYEYKRHCLNMALPEEAKGSRLSQVGLGLRFIGIF